jgi:hypothetical protein
MNTILMTMEEAEQSLAALIRRMRECREYVVVKDDEGPLAYLTLAFRPDPNETYVEYREESKPEGESEPEYNGPRLCYSKYSNAPVVNGRPGHRMVTSEEIYEELRNSFP